jgi:uncharacterized protein YecE (DUF72 family)
MVAWYLGTMGFGYKDWERVFYPDRLSSRNYLRYYSRYFNAVEIDSTFYGTPRLSTVRHWAGITPHDFKICVKTPRRITHELMLKDAVEEMRDFVRVIIELGEKLGVILIQFPPSFTHNRYFNRLEEFLLRLRSSLGKIKDIRFAVEFRHLSCYTTTTAVMLGSYQVCWTATEYPKLPGKIYKTTDYLYIRWIGQHGTYQHHDREREDKTSQLIQWWEQIQDNISNIDAIYGFFNNDYSGHAPVTCNKFKSITGLPTKTLKPPQQGTLF